MTRIFRLALFTIGLALGAGPSNLAPAHAQDSGQQPPAGISDLAPIPIELESVGMKIQLPADSTVTITPQGQRRILARANDERWVIAIDLYRPQDRSMLDSTRLLDAALRKAQSDSTNCLVRHRGTQKFGAEDSHQLIAQLRLGSGGIEIRVVTVFNPSPGTFIVHTLWCDSAHSERVTALNEASLKTIVFEDPDLMAQKRLDAENAVESILTNLTRADYQRLLLPDQWFRIYTPSESGDTEVGYFRIRESIGLRGSVDPNKDPRTFGPGELEKGLITRLDARYLRPDGSIYDVASAAFQSFDRSNETWNIRAAYYQVLHNTRFNPAVLSTVTGDRTGGRIQVVVDEPGQSPLKQTFTRPSRAYVGQAERFLIYRLLKPWTARHYGINMYEPSIQRLTYREEFIAAGKRPGEFVSESRIVKDASPNTVTIDRNGKILRIEKANGEVTEPIAVRDLQRLWKSKGHPTDAMRNHVDRGR